MAESTEEKTVLGGNSRVSIALLTMIFGVTTAAAAGGARWATRIENRLETIERTLLGTSVDRWTESDMQAWVEAFSTKNPALVVPQAEHKYRRDNGGG